MIETAATQYAGEAADLRRPFVTPVVENLGHLQTMTLFQITPP
jgi:hypothetical protein